MNTLNWKNVVLWLIIGGTVGMVAGMWLGYTLGLRASDNGSTEQSEQMQSDNEAMSGGTLSSELNGVDGGALIGMVSTTVGDGGILSVSDQPAGHAVVVNSVDMPSDGWIAVHEILPGDIIGNVLGAVRRDAGVYDSIVVDILRATEPSKSYAVILYADNGNKEFDLSADAPITDASGNPIVERFSAQLPVSPSGR